MTTKAQDPSERTPDPSVQQAHPAPTDPKGLDEIMKELMDWVSSHGEAGINPNDTKKSLEALLAHQRQSIVAEIRKGMPKMRYTNKVIPGVGASATDEEFGYNTALSELDALLNKMEKKHE